MERALIIFIKNPESGRCKTRLAKDIGDANALEVYSRLLDMTRSTCQKINCNKFLFYDRFIDTKDDWPEEEFLKALQSGPDLGARMNAAFEAVLKSNTSAIIIGSDCPELNERILEEAFEALNDHDHVLGPSKDGGYYLLGMKQATPLLFEAMEWSTDSVYAKSIERIRSMGRSYMDLPVLSDVDTLEDLKRFPYLFNDISL